MLLNNNTQGAKSHTIFKCLYSQNLVYLALCCYLVVVVVFYVVVVAILFICLGDWHSLYCVQVTAEICGVCWTGSQDLVTISSNLMKAGCLVARYSYHFLQSDHEGQWKLGIIAQHTANSRDSLIVNSSSSLINMFQKIFSKSILPPSGVHVALNKKNLVPKFPRNLRD